MSKWLFFPSPVASSLTVGTCTGWSISGGHYTSLGWSAGADGAGTTKIILRSDAFGAFLYFTNNTTRDAFRTAYQGYNMRVTDASANVYEWSGGTIDVFTTAILQLGSLTNWSGTLPTASASNASTIELYT